MKRYWYFRNPGGIANDDSVTGDSVLVPVENITGIQSPTITSIVIYFKPEMSGTGGMPGAIINDSVTITIKSGGRDRNAVMRALAESTNNGPHDDGIMYTQL